MLRSALHVLIACLIAIVGGAASLAYALKSDQPIGAVKAGPWLTFPDAGTEQADPYHKALYAIDGVLSLGGGEGMAFYAERDSASENLRGACAYRLSGPISPARFWTLRSEVRQGDAWVAGPAIHSRSLLRRPDNSVELTVSARPAPGNWLPLAASGPFRLVLTLYDPATTTSLASSGTEAPSIEKQACHD